MTNCIAVIPARSGSKTLKDKNIALLGEHPLLAYSIIAAKLSNHIERVIVSTDSKLYADIAYNYGAEVPFIRPRALAEDQSTDYDFMNHAMSWFDKNEIRTPEYWVHLRPTTPLRDPMHIDLAIEKIMSNKEATALRSGHLSPESPFKWFRKNKEGFLIGLIEDETDLDKYNDPRQNYSDVIIPDGYVDIVKYSYVMNEKKLHGNKVLAFESPFCIEVDSLEEFELLNYQINQKGAILYEELKGMEI